LTSPTDPYQEWDVAYVLGSLSPSDRRAYESHLSGCANCQRAVTGLAGMPGILSSVPAERAVELLGPPAPDQEVPAALLPALVAAARSSRRRARFGMAAAMVASAIVGAVLTILLRSEAAPPPAPVPAHEIAFTQTVPSPVTARVNLVEEPWGTRIDIDCDYAIPTGGRSLPTLGYVLYIIDKLGRGTAISTWTAGPGTSTKPTATTDLVFTEIARIQIRLTKNDTVLLEARL